MQDLHAIGGGGGGGAGAGRFFSGGGGDRRLRPHNHHALKCPRCDSLNTKFCYYNNYNLSQPRHFCKACRRYWTKGGVLRSVPVGGGCRKTKRSKPKSNAADTPRERQSKAQSSSSTDSSSLTASTPTSATPAVTEVGSALSATTTSNSATMYNFSDAMFFNVNPPANPNFDNHQPLMNHSSSESQIFSEIGSFTSLMTSSGNAASMMGFSMGGDISTTSYDRLQQVSGAENQVISEMVGPTDVDEFQMQDMTGVTSSDGLAAALDWGNGSGGGEDQGLFDLSAAVDPAYWSQPQWTDNDHSLSYLP